MYKSRQIDFVNDINWILEILTCIFNLDLNLIAFEKNIFVTIFCFNRIKNKHAISAQECYQLFLIVTLIIVQFYQFSCKWYTIVSTK